MVSSDPRRTSTVDEHRMQSLVTGLAVLSATIWIGGSALSGQEPTTGEAPPTFEVASVRPSDSASTTGAFSSRGDRFTATNVRLRRIIELAYGIPPQLSRFRIVGEDQVLSRRFDIQAKMPEGLPSDQIVLRVKSLLVQRFGLRAHSEVRQLPVYALVVARSGAVGPELRPSRHNCNEYRAAWLESHTPALEVVRPRDAKNRPLCATRPDDERAPPGSLQFRDAGRISEILMAVQAFSDRPLVDATQLRGNFEWQITFSPSAMPRQGSDLHPLPVAISEQLGLKLEPRTGPVDVLVIDSVSQPTEN